MFGFQVPDQSFTHGRDRIPNSGGMRNANFAQAFPQDHLVLQEELHFPLGAAEDGSAGFDFLHHLKHDQFMVFLFHGAHS